MRIVRMRFLFALAPVLGFGAINSSEDALPECIVAARWLASHRGDLPKSSQEFAAFPRSYQRVIFGKLPLSFQKELFREHWTDAAQRRDLTQDQRDAVRGMIRNLDAFFDESASRTVRRQRIASHTDSLKRVFSLQLGREIFTLQGFPSANRAIKPRLSKDCDCEFGGGGWCGPNCIHTNESLCNPTDSGCGPGGSWGCNGICI